MRFAGIHDRFDDLVRLDAVMESGNVNRMPCDGVQKFRMHVNEKILPSNHMAGSPPMGHVRMIRFRDRDGFITDPIRS